MGHGSRKMTHLHLWSVHDVTLERVDVDSGLELSSLVPNRTKATLLENVY